MRVWDFGSVKFNEDNFIKDYRKTAEILDEDTRRTIKIIKELESRG